MGGGFVERGGDSDVTFDLCGGRPAGAALSAAEGGGAGDARGTRARVEQGSPDEEQGRGPPAHVQGGAQLPLVGGGDVGVVEIPDDGVGGPADGHQVQEPGDGEEGSGDAGDAGLEAVYADAFGALDPEDAQSQSQTADQDGEDGEAPGRLHVAGQSQQAVVHLTLDLTRALHDAIHPQAFPDDLSSHYVVTDEGSDSPQRDGTDYRPTHPAHQGQDQAQQLHASGCHDERCCLNRMDLSQLYFNL